MQTPTRHTARGAARTLLLISALSAPMLAQGGAIELQSGGNEALLCSVEYTSHGGRHFVAFPTWNWVLPFDKTRYELGWLYAADDFDSPDFESLTLRCVRRDRVIVGEVPGSDEPSYSLELARHDPLWIVSFGSGKKMRQLPRNGTRVSFRLGSTGLPLEPLRLVNMKMRDDAIEPSWKLRYYVPASAYRLAVDETDDSAL